MRKAHHTTGLLLVWVLLVSANGVSAQDWPQWRGPNRDNKVTGFTAPTMWPRELTQQWRVRVGYGTASPALVGDKLYVFTRQGGDELTSCLDAATGKILWQDKYTARAVTGATMAFLGPGPRSSPAVAEGVICTFGVGGVLSCLNAATGKLVWRKDTNAWPTFFTRASPIIVDGKCIAYVGTRNKGEISALDLNSGEPKWTWTGEGPSYGSPVLLTVADTQQIVTPTESSLVSIRLADGKLLWRFPFTGRLNSSTPLLHRQTVIYSGWGVGTVALKIEKEGEGFVAKELWRKTQNVDLYNAPVVKDGLLFGVAAGRGGLSTNGNFFCMNVQTGDVLWTDTSQRGNGGVVLNAGDVLLALTAKSELVAFRPSNKEYVELAKYKVADTMTQTYPIIAGKRVFVKDTETLTLWTIP
jgi:outer membrane protein assembly factor BamB